MIGLMRFGTTVLAVVAVMAACAVPASAEIVYLQSGRTLSVKAHRYEGESIILTLRGGGEVTCDRTLVDRVVPDEVPYIEPAPPATEGETDLVLAPRALEAETPYGEIISAVAEAHGVDPLLVS